LSGEVKMHCVELSNFELDDYVTAIAWMPDGSGFAAATARGEIVYWNENLDPPKSPLSRGTKSLREADGFSIDALAFSENGQYLAAAGQSGKLYVWDGRELVATLIYSGWIDQLAWHPGRSLLAFGVGKLIYIWNAETRTLESSLELLESSVLGLTWNAQGDRLMASGNRVVKCWDVENWNTAPQVWELSAACGSIDWALGDLFFAAGCFDRTVIVASEFGSDNPWRMSGFPEKVSLVAWSSVMKPATDCPLLATVSGDGIVIWNWTGDGWDGNVITSGGGRINSIAWQPGSLVFAIAVEERVELRVLILDGTG
jgi:WD40 repeat protein